MTQTIIAQLTSGWSPEQVAKATSVAQKWATSPRQERGWSCPVALRYGDKWEFIIKGDYAGIEDPDEFRSLRPLVGR